MILFLQLGQNYAALFVRAQMREKHMSKRLESDLWKAQKSCRQLDLGKEYSEPVEFWFWPKEKDEKVLGYFWVHGNFLNIEFKLASCQS